MNRLAACVPFALAASCSSLAFAQQRGDSGEAKTIPFPHPVISEVLAAVPNTNDVDPSRDNVRDPVGDEFVEFSPEAAARIVDVSERVEGRSENDFAFDLSRDTTESGVYPIALVSYHIVCLEYDSQEKVDLVKSFMAWVGSEEGQAASQASAGSAPISPEIRAQLTTVIDSISVGS